MAQAHRLMRSDDPGQRSGRCPRLVETIVAWSDQRRALLIFTLAILPRVIWIVTLRDDLTWIDEHEFVAVAQHLARGEGYVSTSFRTNPVLPIYLSLVFRAFGEHYVVARLGQCVVGALTCVLLEGVGSLLVSPLAGLVAGMLLAVYLPHIYLAGVFYVDSWLTFFCALSVYLAARTMNARGHLGFACACGVCLGLTGLTRANFLTYLPCVCLAWFYGRRCGWPRQLAACVLLVAGCALTILPWTARNYVLYRRPILISSGFYTMLWRGNNPLATGGPDDRIFMWNTPDWNKRLEKLPEDQQRALREQYQLVERLVVQHPHNVDDPYLATDDVLKPLAIESVVSHPGRTLLLMIRKVRTLFSAFSGTETTNQDTSSRNRLLAQLSFYPILALATIGAVIGWPRRRELALIYLVIAAVIGSYAMLTACTRFRLPIDPYLILFAALTLTRLMEGAGFTTRMVSGTAGGVRRRQ